MSNRIRIQDGVDREGFAMVTALLVVLVLSVLAVGAAWLATSEKKTTQAEAVHMRSVFSADAGGEAAINFVRTSNQPPQILDFTTMAVRSQPTTSVEGSQAFAYDVNFTRRAPKPGWGPEYQDFDYRIASLGQASRTGQSGVDVVVSRLFKVGY
jgi:hypothetical protein